MSDHMGMTRRELERELAWILRSPPDDPRALAKLLADAMVTLMDKNNGRIAEHLASQGDADVDEDF